MGVLECWADEYMNCNCIVTRQHFLVVAWQLLSVPGEGIGYREVLVWMVVMALREDRHLF